MFKNIRLIGLLVCLLLALVLGGTSAAAQSIGALDAYDAGILAFWQRDWQRMYEHFDEAVDLEPDWAEALAFRANALRLLDEVADGQDDIEEALDLYPDSPVVLVIAARFYLLEGNQNAALDAVEEALERGNKNGFVVYYAGSVYSLTGDDREAIDLYNEAMGLSVGVDAAEVYFQSAMYFWRGWSYYYLGNLNQALEDFEEALDLAPDVADYWVDFARMLSEAGDYDEAVEAAEAAIDLNPELSNAYYQRGYAYGEMGECELAIEDYDRAIEINPASSFSYNNRGWCYEQLGDLDRAMLSYAAARQVDVTNDVAQANGNNLLYSYYALRLSDLATDAWVANSDNGGMLVNADGTFTFSTSCGSLDMPLLFAAAAYYTLTLNGDDLLMRNEVYYFADEDTAEDVYDDIFDMMSGCRGNGSDIVYRRVTPSAEVAQEVLILRFEVLGFFGLPSYLGYAVYMRTGNVIYTLGDLFPATIVELDTQELPLSIGAMLTRRIVEAPGFGGL